MLVKANGISEIHFVQKDYDYSELAARVDGDIFNRIYLEKRGPDLTINGRFLGPLKQAVTKNQVVHFEFPETHRPLGGTNYVTALTDGHVLVVTHNINDGEITAYIRFVSDVAAGSYIYGSLTVPAETPRGGVVKAGLFHCFNCLVEAFA